MGGEEVAQCGRHLATPARCGDDGGGVSGFAPSPCRYVAGRGVFGYRRCASAADFLLAAGIVALAHHPALVANLLQRLSFLCGSTCRDLVSSGVADGGFAFAVGVVGCARAASVLERAWYVCAFAGLGARASFRFVRRFGMGAFA